MLDATVNLQRFKQQLFRARYADKHVAEVATCLQKLKRAVDGFLVGNRTVSATLPVPDRPQQLESMIVVETGTEVC